MDVLSEVLRVVRLSGVVHFCGEFSRPWAILSSRPEALARRLGSDAECVTPFHVVAEGTCWVRCGDLPPMPVHAGDLLVFPRGDQHVMASDLGEAPVPIQSLYPAPSDAAIAVLAHGGGGERARFICGYLTCDQRFNPLLEALPPVLRIRFADGTVRLEAPGEARQAAPIGGDAAQWWASSLRYVVSEATGRGPGNREILARLSELLFMQVLRWQMGHAAAGRRGWLAGLNDPHVGRALRLMHADPARRWTVDLLAREAGVSRAVLAARFVELVGESPMRYLGGWRMHLAKRMLREERLGVGGIARRLGYASEPGFNRAFRRIVGLPPAAWRDRAARPDAPAGAPRPARPHPDGMVQATAR